MDEAVKQVIVVDQETQYEDRVSERMAFFNPDGTPYEGLPSDAADISFDAAGTIASTNVQDAVEEVATDAATALTAHLDDTTDAHDASAISFAPAGAIAATTVQAAIVEVATESPVLTPITTATAIDTAAKTTASAEPTANTLVLIKFTNGNSAETPTIAFNGGSARAIKLGGTASVAAKCTIAADGIGLFFFDGTVLHQVGVLS